MADEGKGFWSSLPGILTGIAAVIGAFAGLYVALKPATPVYQPPTTIPTGPAEPAKTPPQVKAGMGGLQRGWNYNHGDLDPTHPASLTSPEACSDMCRANAQCKAMTYVVSLRTCWLKDEVLARTPDADMVSAVKN